MRFKFGEVDFDDLVVFGIFVGGEMEVCVFGCSFVGEVFEGLDVLNGLGMVGGFEVMSGGSGVREDGGGGIDFSVYVVDGCYIG